MTGAAIAASAARGQSGESTPIPVPEGRLRVLIDTDAANYCDDQFALAYAALSGEAIEIEAIYAAPFVNRRSKSPASGMEQSLAEIERLLGVLEGRVRCPVLEGSRAWLSDTQTPVKNPASLDLIERVMDERDEGLYVVSIGAATNVASALQIEPSLAHRINVVWLGGAPHSFPSASEFNLRQDPAAARTLFESGARLMHVPAPGLAENLSASPAELRRRLTDSSPIGKDLLRLYEARAGTEKRDDHSSVTQPIWDLAPIAWLVNPEWVQSAVVSSPVLTDDLQWETGTNRHRVRTAIRVLRDKVMTDFFGKVRSASA